MNSTLSSHECALITAYAHPVPRYTSYPTAPHFHGDVGPNQQTGWIEALDPASSLSLYFHIPYCDTLCWFCGCHTKITRRYDPVANYIPALEAEMRLVRASVPAGVRVTSVHWGGGSPTMLSPPDIERLASGIDQYFDVEPDAEFAIEIDPRGLDRGRIDALAKGGVTRASIGVQDFDPTVQAAINRVQSFDETSQVVRWLRDAEISSINIDAMYGLPHQTLDAVTDTMEKVVSLAPDRVALFGYAHVPWLKRHQSMIDEAALPNTVERFRQSTLAAQLLIAAGYRQIGLDHFARSNDGLARALDAGTLRRNFQGYTSDTADALIGFGASAISCLPQGYSQNETAIAQYRARVEGDQLATVRGVSLGLEDVVRRWVIERIMCDFAFSGRALTERFETNIDAVLEEARGMGRFERDALIEATEDGFRVTQAGRPFVRAICAHFDAYLQTRDVGHSAAV